MNIKFSYPIYNLIVFIKLLEIVPKKFFKFVLFSKDPLRKKYFWQRLGVLPAEMLRRLKGKDIVWINCLSLGEVNAIKNFLSQLKAKYPAKSFVISSANFSGYSKALEYSGLADGVFFTPYDLTPIVNNVINLIKPSLVLIVDSDLAPNFIRALDDKKIPIALISGRFSGIRFFYNYTFRLNKDIFDKVNLYCMQSANEAAKLDSYVTDKSRVLVCGDLKFSSFASTGKPENEPIKRSLGINESEQVFVAGSVHGPEIEPIFDAYKKLRSHFSSLKMIIAPRNLSIVKDIEAASAKNGIPIIKKSVIASLATEGGGAKQSQEIASSVASLLPRNDGSGAQVIILDTEGELSSIYSVASVAFVGGSLAYLGRQFGGHNILEPAIFGVPVIFGPHMHNFSALADLFLAEDVGFMVKDSDDLVRVAGRFLAGSLDNNLIKTKFEGLFRRNAKVIENTLDAVNKIIATSDTFCQVCQSKDARLLIRQGNFRIMRCRKCGLVYSLPIPNKAELDAYYQQFAYNQVEMGFVDENKEVGEYVAKMQLDVMKNINPTIEAGKYLDIGCGCGFFLWGEKQAGFDCYGIEKDKVAAEFARKNFGLNIQSVDLEDAKFADNYFDVVRMRQLIEHLPYPKDFVKEIKRILKPGGILLIETANTDSLETIPRLYFLDSYKKLQKDMPELGALKRFMLAFRREWAFTDPPRHIYGFNKKNMRIFFEQNGFEPKLVLTAMMGDKVYYPISKGHKAQLDAADLDARKRLWQKNKFAWAGYKFIFKPAMAVFNVYLRLTGGGSHVIGYGVKK